MSNTETLANWLHIRHCMGQDITEGLIALAKERYMRGETSLSEMESFVDHALRGTIAWLQPGERVLSRVA